MGQLRELVEGDSILDTAFRALALTIIASVTLALVLTTLSVRAADYPQPDFVSAGIASPISGLAAERQFSVLHKEQEQ